MEPEHIARVDRDAEVWIEPGGGITIKAVTPDGDPVELSATQARTLAAALVHFADLEDTEPL